MQGFRDKRADKAAKFQGLRAKAPIAAQFEDCVQAFEQFSDILEVNHGETALRDIARDCKIKLKVWGDDSCASSRLLDYALRGSDLLARQALRLLTDLHSVLDEARSRIRSQDLEIDDGIDRSTVEEDATESVAAAEEVAGDDQDADLTPEASLQEAVDIVECLEQLLPSLRDPREEHNDEPVLDFDDGYGQDAYRGFAAALFPNSTNLPLLRLGRNSWARRQELRRVSNKLRYGTALKPTGKAPKGNSTLWPANARRVYGVSKAYSVRRPSARSLSDAGASTARTNLESNLSIKGHIDQESNTSVADVPQPFFQDRFTMPEPPADLDKTEQFSCPFCHFELPLTVSSKHMDLNDWHSHVYHDLRPYICTFGDCDQEVQSFNTREEWFQHELNHHRTRQVWFCGQCRVDFNSEHELRHHLVQNHGFQPTDEHFRLLGSCKRYSQELLSDQQCTLCNEPFDDINELEEHIAEHLERFALATIWENDVPEDDGSDGGGGQLLDYISEQRQMMEQDDSTLIFSNDTETIQMQQRVYGIADTEASRIVDTSDPSGVDDVEREVKPTADDGFWSREKVKAFLEKQPNEEPVAAVRCNLPPLIENFTGRVVNLKDMHRHLSTPGRICTLSGPAGIGKSSIAITYAHEKKKEYPYIFWVDVETPGLAAEKYNMIASQLNLIDAELEDENDHTFLIRESLAKTQRRWLLIFDNVTSWNDIADYVPRNLPRTNGSVVTTTRNGPLLNIPPKSLLHHHQHSVELDVWPLTRAREYLLTSIQPWNLREEDLQAHEEYEVAARVVDLVGRLPLAINIIVGYVKVSRCSLEDFIEMWEENDYIRRTKGAPQLEEEGEFDGIFDLLWTIGIKEVKSNSRRLLEALSFLNPKKITKSLLVGDHTEEYLDFLNVADAIGFKRMINELSGRRLIWIKEPDSKTKEQSYGMSKLLSRKILRGMRDYGDAFRRAFRLLRKKFPTAPPQQVPNSETFDICQEQMPHLLSLLKAVDEFDPFKTLRFEPQPIEVAELFYDTGFYVWSRQTTAYDCLDFLTTAQRIIDNEKESAANPKLQADILCVTGLALLERGCVERSQASALLERAWEIRKVIYKEIPTHDNDVLSQNAAGDYSLALLDQHRFQEAGRYIKMCRDRYLVWGPEEVNPFEHSKFYGNYCVVLMMEGKMEEAVQFATKSIELTQRFSGKKAALYYDRVFMLACILFQSGDFQGALNKHLEVLENRVELHGRLHEYTILSMYAVGATYYYLGHILTATDYMRECIDCVKDSKWDTAALARAQWHLARMYRKQNIKEQEAAALEAEASKVIEEYGKYAAECVRRNAEPLMILHDLQPTFSGRFTGRGLLPFLRADAAKWPDGQPR